VRPFSSHSPALAESQALGGGRHASLKLAVSRGSGSATTPSGAAIWDLPALDMRRPNSARIYGYLLGGKDNFQADRAEAGRLLAVYPAIADLARQNRAFLGRAVTWLAQQGVRQFIDVGSGLPAADSTHLIARAVDTSCHVVYADNDPVVVSHASAILAGDGVAAIDADMRDPSLILTHHVTKTLIKPGEPTAVILGMVLHFFDAETAKAIAAAFTDWLATGSYIVMSVGTADPAIGNALAREYTAAEVYNHTVQEAAGFLSGVDLLPPGLVDADAWDPCAPERQPAPSPVRILAGVGRKPR
jgi:hypothetical protein